MRRGRRRHRHRRRRRHETAMATAMDRLARDLIEHAKTVRWHRTLAEAIRPAIQMLARQQAGEGYREWLAIARQAGLLAGPDGTCRGVPDIVERLFKGIKETEEAGHVAITE